MAIAPISVGDTNARAKMNEVIAKANLVDGKASAAALTAGLASEASARQVAISTEAAARRADILALPLPMPVQHRPGDAPLDFGQGLPEGEAMAEPVSASLLRYDDSGRVVRLTGDSIVAPRHLYALEPGRRYLVTFVVQRRVNSPDPDNDAIRCALAWYGQGKGRLPSPAQTVVQDLLGLATGSGRQVVRAVVSRAASSDVDVVSPAGARYVRPYVQTFGTLVQNDVEVVRWTDITDAVAFAPDVSALDDRVAAIESLDLGDRISTIEAQVTAPNEFRVATMGDLEAATIPVSADTVLLLGFHSPGDGAAHRRVWVPIGDAAIGDRQSLDGRWWRIAEPIVTVRQLGAVGNYVSAASPGADDTAAFQAFAAYLKTRGGRGRIEGGRYRLTDDIDFYRPASSGIRIELIGDGEYYSVIVSDFFGAGKSVFKSRDPAGLARSGQFSVFGMSFESVTRTGGRVPCFLDIGGWGESRFDRIRFGASNNTHIRASSIQNVRGSNLTSFFGGKHYLHKPTDGLTFTTTNGGNTITASAAIFSAEDIGLTFNVLSSDGNTNAKYTIAGITSSTVATVVGTTIPSAGQRGHFQSAVGTVDIGVDAGLLTAASGCFTADDVGQWIYIDGAAVGSYGATHHRCQITEVVAANQVRFSPAATRSVSQQLFAIAVADIYMQSGFGSLLQDTNDFIFDKIQIESFGGVALAMERRSIFARISGKLHGVSSMWGDALASTAHAWLSGVSGEISCVLDGPHNSANRMVFSNQNDTLSIPWISSRMFRNETLFRVDEFTSPGGLVAIHDLTTYSFRTDPMLLVADANAERRLQFVGSVNMLGDSALSRQYLGGSTFADLAGRLSLGDSAVFADYLLSLASSSATRMLFERIGSRRYSIGNNVGTSWTLRDETAALDRLIMLATGALTPGADGTQALGSPTLKWAGVYGSFAAITDGIAAPSAVAGMAAVYVDAADGDLKVKFSDGTIKTIVTDA